MIKLKELNEMLLKMLNGSCQIFTVLCLIFLAFSCSDLEEKKKNNENVVSLVKKEKEVKEVAKKISVRPIIKDSSIVFFEKITNKDNFLEIQLGKYINDKNLDSVYYVLDLKNILPKDTPPVRSVTLRTLNVFERHDLYFVQYKCDAFSFTG